MNLHALVNRMESFPRVVSALTATLDGDDARWKPESGAWSILEVVCHIADEETRDFRARVESTLHDPGAPWIPIDPEGWARDEGYNQRDLEETVARFIEDRGESVRWLRMLLNPDWSLAYEHPKAGPLRAGDVMASWAAHDALHLRQIAKRLYELADRDSPGHSLAYAGAW